jgi:hypothetical protein
MRIYSRTLGENEEKEIGVNDVIAFETKDERGKPCALRITFLENGEIRLNGDRGIQIVPKADNSIVVKF